MMVQEPGRAIRWAIAGCRYIVIILGLYLISKLAVVLIALGIYDLGLKSTSLTWLGVGVLGVDLVLILYLELAFLMLTRRRSSASLYMAPVVLCITVVVALWASQGINNDCIAADAFVVCVATRLIWMIMGFAIGSLGLLVMEKKHNRNGSSL